MKAEIDRLLPGMPRRDVIRASLEGRGALILTRSMEQACEISNRIAPEHLEVSSRDPQRFEPLLRHAGAIFLGAYTSESLGDYCAGPNHVLPTSGTARFSSPLGVYDFQKRSSLIEVSEAGCAGARRDRRRARARRRPARPRAGCELRLRAENQDLNRNWRHEHAFRSNAKCHPPGRAIDARLRDPAKRRPHQARRDGKPVPLAGRRCSKQLGERLGRVAINRYPGKCIDDVVAALTPFVGVPHGCKLMLGNGSDELITMLSMAVDVPGASILAPLPGFVMYEMSARLQGVPFVGVPLTADFELDEAAMLAAIDKHRPSITYIAYPNNPTANLFSDAIIDKIVAAVGAQGHGLVVFDEAYQPFSSRTWMDRMASHPHVLVMRTLSKFGLAGVRLGYLCRRGGADRRDQQGPPAVQRQRAERGGDAVRDRARRRVRAAGGACIRAERERLQHALKAMPGVQPFPSDANMILVRVPDSKRAFEGMKARGVLVKHIAGLHPLLANCLRLTVGTPEENTAMIDALKASL